MGKPARDRGFARAQDHASALPAGRAQTWSEKAPGCYNGRVAESNELATAPESVVAICGGVATLAWGLAVNPSDLGGTFLRVWLTGMGAAGWWGAGALPRSTRIACAAFLPFLIAIEAATVYFAPQAMLPFAVVLGLLFLAVRLRSAVAAVVLVLLAGAGFPWLGYGLDQAKDVSALRTLRPSEVTSITLRPEGGRPARLSPGRIPAFVAALHPLRPYSPNHESLHGAEVEVATPERTLRFRIGHGNRANPDAAWIELGVCSYQALGFFREVSLPELERPAPSR
jgi:hypothetical protein